MNKRLLFKIHILFRKLFWYALTLLMPRRRPYEVVYGKARYCLARFEQDFSYEQCGSNWMYLHRLVDSSSFLVMIGMYGTSDTFDILIDIAQVYDAGDEIRVREKEEMSENSRNEMARRCWHEMQRRLYQFIDTEPVNITSGAKLFCENLLDNPSKYEMKSVLDYPVFRL